MRRYNHWAGNPKGTPEDPTRCAASVPDGGQCTRKRTCGELCRQHMLMVAKGAHVYVPAEES